MFGNSKNVKEEALKVLDEAENRNGHIFNLGHGILPKTPIENVEKLIETVHNR